MAVHLWKQKSMQQESKACEFCCERLVFVECCLCLLVDVYAAMFSSYFSYEHRCCAQANQCLHLVKILGGMKPQLYACLTLAQMQFQPILPEVEGTRLPSDGAPRAVWTLWMGEKFFVPRLESNPNSSSVLPAVIVLIDLCRLPTDV